MSGAAGHGDGLNGVALMKAFEPVPDPASGSVPLRSIVTGARGNSTTETIYRAYAVG